MAFGDRLKQLRQQRQPQQPVPPAAQNPFRPAIPQSPAPGTRTMAPGTPIGTQAMQQPSTPGMGPSAGPKRRRPGQSPTGLGSAAMGAFSRGAY